MANYCSNKAEFSGENSQMVLEHFSSMGYDSPPFYDILIDNDAVHFESRWIPQIKDLCEIAENYGVDFKLVYQVPHERTKEKYSYTCLQNRNLEGLANDLKALILKATSVYDLEKASESINDKGQGSQINKNEWTILAYLAEKKYNEIATPARQPHQESSDFRRRTGR